MASEREKIIAQARDHATALALVAVRTRVKAEAIPDFMRRGFEAYEGEPFTEQAALAWGKSQQTYASHLFEAPALQAPETPAQQAGSSSRDYDAIPRPEDRLTAWRADEQAKAQAGSQP